MIILGRTHFFSNVRSSLNTRMLAYKYVGLSGLSPLPICDRVPTTVFDNTSLDQDYLHELDEHLQFHHPYTFANVPAMHSVGVPCHICLLQLILSLWENSAKWNKVYCSLLSTF